MENNVIEQPSLETEGFCAETDSKIQEGSIFGKFKDAKSLLDAYNNLEAEFTRKSQKLAEFQRENQNNAVFEQVDNIDEFLKSTGNENYKKEITEILDHNSDINNLPNKYQIALKIITEAERKSAQNLNDQNFIDKYVISNEEIKKKIIADYLSKLNKFSDIPKVMSGNSTNICFSPKQTKPTTLKEAGELFSKMLK